MTRGKLTQFQRVVPADEITSINTPTLKVRAMLVALLDYLELEVIVEETPDYHSYEIRRRKDIP